jgi:hypothetical protein
MQITSNQRKLIWIVAAILGLCYFAPSLIQRVQYAVAAEQPEGIKPSPAHIATTPPAPTVPPPSTDAAALQASATAAQFDKLADDWLGSALLPGGLCRLGLQIRKAPDKPENYKGFSTISCNTALKVTDHPATPENRAKMAIASMTPTSTIMTGTIKNGQIVFAVDQAIGTPPDGCGPITSFTVSPFADQIAAVWQQGDCKSEQMVLNRVTNLH